MTEKLEHCPICDPFKNYKPIVMRSHVKSDIHKRCQYIHDFHEEKHKQMQEQINCANENAKATAERRNKETNIRCSNRIEDLNNKLKSSEMEKEQIKNENQQQKETIVYQANKIAKQKNTDNKIKKKKKKKKKTINHKNKS